MYSAREGPAREAPIGFRGAARERRKGAFDCTGDPLEDLCAILAVHPMKEPAVNRYLSEVGLGRESVDALVASGRVKRVEYRGEVFYVRRFAGVGDVARG